MQQGTYGAVAAFRDETGQEHPCMSQWWMGLLQVGNAHVKRYYIEMQQEVHSEFTTWQLPLSFFLLFLWHFSWYFCRLYIVDSFYPKSMLDSALWHTPRIQLPGGCHQKDPQLLAEHHGGWQALQWVAMVTKLGASEPRCRKDHWIGERRKSILQLQWCFFVQNLIGELKLCLLWWMKYVKLNELTFLFPFSKLYSILLFSREPFWEAKRCLREIKLLKMLDHENVIELFQALDFHLIKFSEFALHFHLQKWMRLLEKWLRLTIDYTPETLTWPLENDGWKTTHSLFGIGPFSGGEVKKTSRDSLIGTPPGGTGTGRKPWQVLAPPCTVFNEVYLVTELCDADLHTVINSDTPLSTWVTTRFLVQHVGKDVQLFAAGKNGMLLAVESLGILPSCSCFASWNLRRRSCAIFRISHSQSTIVPWHWHQMGHATHPTPKKWHPTFGHKTDIFVPVTLIRCKQMQWGICTLRMLCTGIWNPWMFWPLGSAFIFCYQRLNFNQVSLWTLWGTWISVFPETTKVMKNCDIK